MCEPTSIIAGISLVVGVVTSMMQMQAQNAASKENSKRAVDAYVIQTAEAQNRTVQEQVAGAQQKEDARLKTMSDVGKVQTAAAAGGVQGSGVQTLVGDFYRSLGTFSDRTDQQTAANVGAIRADQQGLRAQSDARIASVPMAGWDGVFGAAFEGGLGLAGSYFGGPSTTKDPKTGTQRSK